MITLEKFLPYYLLAGSVLLLANAIWLFRDARQRGRSGVLVAALVCSSFPIGVFLWLAARPAVLPWKKEGAPVDPEAGIKARANDGLL